MKRRQLIQYGGVSLLTALSAAWLGTIEPSRAQSGGTLQVKWLGHTCFLFSGGGERVLVNPFRTLGCTKGYRLPRVASDLTLISSQLYDEGAAENLPGNPDILFEPGVYEIGTTQFQGISLDHDRVGGRRFGRNVAWRWKQAGIDILHLGGAAGSIGIEEQILMGRPDLLLVPVGGGPKAYDPQEAMQAVRALRPKMVIPTHYLTQAADPATCDIVSVDDFLTLMGGNEVQRLKGDTLNLSAGSLPSEGTSVRVLKYRF